MLAVLRGRLANKAGELTDAIKESTSVIEGERRQLTVMFCDMVDFTELSSRVDPEILQQIICRYEDTCAECVTRYEGYVYQRLGDGIVAFFGYPFAHEGEAERAIHAGLAIISALKDLEVPEVTRLEVRIGIASGLVVVTSVEKGAVGETMNLAARLQAIAAPGSVVVSEPVLRLAGGTFNYTALGAQYLKGIAAPQPTYRVDGVSGAGSRFEAATRARLTPLVGRHQELGVLLERWQLAQEGDGQVVLLAGPPGIGKSRTMNTLRERLGPAAPRTLRFQCSPYHTHSAYYPLVVQLVREVETAAQDDLTALERLDALVQARCGLSPRAAQVLAALLGLAHEGRYPIVTTTPQRDKEDTLQALVDLTVALAHAGPLLFLFEDAHWADPTTLEYLALLVKRIEGAALLAVITHRPDFQVAWSQQGHVATLTLARLSRRQSEEAIARVAEEKTLPAELVAQLTVKADGIPLYLEELTRAVLESGQLQLVGERYEVVGTAAVMVPSTLRDSLMARLDRLPTVKVVAQTAAVIGREFGYLLLSAVAGMTAPALAEALQQLEDSGLAFRRGEGATAVYTFKHALVQDVAYESLLKSRRQSLHRAIAETFERILPQEVTRAPEVLARHYTAAALPAAAVPQWIKAGEQAMARVALHEAILHLNAGLEALPELPESNQRIEWELELRTLLSLAHMWFQGWQAEQIVRVIEPALPLARAAKRGNLLAGMLYHRVAHLTVVGRTEAGLQFGEEAASIARELQSSVLAATGAFLVVALHTWRGDWQIADSRYHDAYVFGSEDDYREIVRTIGADTRHNTDCQVTMIHWARGRADTALSFHALRSLEIERHGTIFLRGFWLTTGSLFLDWVGDNAALRRNAMSTIALGEENALPLYKQLWGPYFLALASVRLERTDQTLATFSDAIARWQASGAHILVPYMKTALAEETLAFGDAARAWTLIEESLDQLYRPGWGEHAWLPEALRVKARLLAFDRKVDDAAATLREALTVAERQGGKAWALRAATDLADLALAHGDAGPARDTLAPLYCSFTEGFGTRDLQRAAVLLAKVT